MRIPRRPAIVVIIAAVALTACTGDPTPGATSPKPAISATMGRASVEAPPSWSGELKVTPATTTTPLLDDGGRWIAAGVMVGAPLSVTASAELPAEGVTISRRYPVALGDGVTATLGYFDEDAGSWFAVPSTLSADRRSVSATVHHLSDWTDFVFGEDSAVRGLGNQLSGTMKSAQDWVGDAVNGVKTWTSDRMDDIYWAVGKVFDTRVDPPDCSTPAPSWVGSTVHIATDKNNSVLFCTGGDPKQPGLVVLRARVNRGFPFTATLQGRASWRFNSSDGKGAWDTLVPLFTSTDSAFRDALFAVSGGDPRLRVDAGEELSLALSEAQARAIKDHRALRLNLPAPPTFLLSLTGQLLMQYGMEKDDSFVSASLTLAACWKDLTTAQGNDVLELSKGVLSCANSQKDAIAERIAQSFAKLNRPAAAKEAKAVVGRISVYLGLIGPVFNSMNYAAESSLPETARTIDIFPTVLGSALPALGPGREAALLALLRGLGLVTIEQWDGCSSLLVYGADLEHASVDFATGFAGGICGGDAAGDYFSVRNGKVIKKAAAVEGWDNSEWEAATRPYRDREVTSYFFDGVGLLEDFDCQMTPTARAMALGAKFEAAFAGSDPWASSPRWTQVADRRFERMAVACGVEYAVSVAAELNVVGPTSLAIDDAIHRHE